MTPATHPRLQTLVFPSAHPAVTAFLKFAVPQELEFQRNMAANRKYELIQIFLNSRWLVARV